ncbi:MAG: carboxypeptidase regulatory-like domain-containing protein [Candidatus Zipacnadales bacterium]
MTRALVMFTLFSVVCLLVGCGGSEGPGPVPPASGEVTGRIVGVPNPQSYTITVDGAPIDVQPDADGRFRIPALPPGQHTIGYVAPGGNQGGYVTVRIRRGQSTDLGDLKPILGGQIAGIVSEIKHDGSLVPVVNTEVVAAPSTATNVDPGGTISLMRGGTTGENTPDIITAYTDENGSYLMKAVPCGGYDVSVVVPGYEPQVQYVYVSPGQTAVADFMLYPTPEQGVGTVSGVVTGKGVGPLEGARVTVTIQNPWPIPLPCEVLERWLNARRGGGGVVPSPGDPNCPIYIEWDMFSTLTDTQGQYTLNVPIGTHWIECWLDGWEWAGQDVTIEKNQTTTVNFQLAKLNEAS